MGNLSDEIPSIVGNMLMQKHSSKRDFGLGLYRFLKSTALLFRSCVFKQMLIYSVSNDRVSLLGVSGVGLGDTMKRKRHTLSALLALKVGWACQAIK